MVAFHDVSHTYVEPGRRLKALSGFSLTIETGSFVCLVGPSGCGKTTALNIAAGFVAPTSGIVTADGEEVRGPGGGRAVVFQEDAVFPWQTVAQNVAYGVESAPLRPGRRRNQVLQTQANTASRYLAAVGLEGVGTSFPRQLSGGMRKRVDIARAFASGAKTLLMDEPFGSLDVLTREIVHEALYSLQERERKTILFVTHDIEEAVLLGDRVVVMTPAPGRIAMDVSVDFPRPRDRSLARTTAFNEIRWAVEEAIHAEGAPPQ